MIIPGCETLRGTTLEALQNFADKGGNILFAGEVAGYVDAERNDDVKELAGHTKQVAFTRTALVKELESYREIEIRERDGKLADHLLCQMRRDGGRKWLFLANGRAELNKDIPQRHELDIHIKGSWTVKQNDTLNDRIVDLESIHSNGDTFIPLGYAYP